MGGPIPGTTTTYGAGEEAYYITVTNASAERDIVVTHVWVESDPPIHILDSGLPVRLKYDSPWETSVPVAFLPTGTAEVEYLARCQHLLRQGQFVADVCFVAPEGAPQRFVAPIPAAEDLNRTE